MIKCGHLNHCLDCPSLPARLIQYMKLYVKNVIYFNIDKPGSNYFQIPLEKDKELLSVLDIQVPIFAEKQIEKRS